MTIKHEPYHSREYTEKNCPYCDKEVYSYARSVLGVELLVDKEKGVIVSEKGRIYNGRFVHNCEGYLYVLDRMRSMAAWI